MSFVSWYFATLRHVLRAPNEFWARIQSEREAGWAIWFGAICILIGLGLDASLQIYLIDWMQVALRQKGELVVALAKMFNMQEAEFLTQFSTQLAVLQKQSWLVLLLLPVISFFAIHLFAGALYVTLRGFGFVGAKQSLPYESVLRIVAFAQAPIVFTFVPMLGPWIAAIWFVVLMVKGLKSHYQLGSFSGAVAVLAPAFFLKMTWGSALQLMAISVPNQYFEAVQTGSAPPAQPTQSSGTM
jgi:hypothetical protein